MLRPVKTALKASILIVEDEPRQLRYYAKTLHRYDLTCVSARADALAALAQRLPDLILLDNALANGDCGLDLLPDLKARAPHVPVVMISGTLDIAGKMGALQGPLSAHYVLEKPVDLDELDAIVEKALTECGLGEAVRMLRGLEAAEKIESNDPERRFTERLARQHALVNLLRRSSTKPNISTLARDFNVSRKTIRRDIRDLIQRSQLDRALFPEDEAEPTE